MVIKELFSKDGGKTLGPSNFPDIPGNSLLSVRKIAQMLGVQPKEITAVLVRMSDIPTYSARDFHSPKESPHVRACDILRICENHRQLRNNLRSDKDGSTLIRGRSPRYYVFPPEEDTGN